TSRRLGNVSRQLYPRPSSLHTSSAAYAPPKICVPHPRRIDQVCTTPCQLWQHNISCGSVKPSRVCASHFKLGRSTPGCPSGCCKNPHPFGRTTYGFSTAGGH